jgi:hypothetical protein
LFLTHATTILNRFLFFSYPFFACPKGCSCQAFGLTQGIPSPREALQWVLKPYRQKTRGAISIF